MSYVSTMKNKCDWAQSDADDVSADEDWDVLSRSSVFHLLMENGLRYEKFSD